MKDESNGMLQAVIDRGRLGSTNWATLLVLPGAPVQPPSFTSRLGFVGSHAGQPVVRDAYDPDQTLTTALPSPPPPRGTWVAIGPTGDLTPLASPESARAALYEIAVERTLEMFEDERVRAETARWVTDPGIDDPKLTDLTDLAFVSIDEPWSRDLDQACYFDQTETGPRIWYAIADAAHFVPLDSALFAASLRRGATFYLPGLVVPMLPPALSEDLVSLNPNVDRRALVFEVQLDGEGAIVETRFHRARVRSRAKLDFGGVQRFLDGEIPCPSDDPGVAPCLYLLREVGELRLKLAVERDVVRYRRAEISIRLADRDGLRFVATTDLRHDVERYNEQISILCNVEGARFLLGGEPSPHVHPIFRVHAPPAPERLDELELQLRAIAELRGLDPAQWVWRQDSGIPLSEFLGGLPTEGGLARVAKAVSRQVMLTNQRSVFATEAAGHHGVGAPVYGRFTAPMREVVGVFVHNELWEKRSGQSMPLPEGYADADALREAVVATANESRSLQRDLNRDANRVVLDQLFGDDLAQTEAPLRSGTIMGISHRKVHVQLDEPPVDVKVYISHLERRGTRLRHDDSGTALLRKDDGTVAWGIGDGVQLQVVGQDERTDRWELTLRKQR